MKRCAAIRLALATCAILSATAVSGATIDLSYCTVCHGANGNGNTAIRAPKISGMEPWYLRRQLEAFANGLRGVHPADDAGHEMQPVGVRLQETAALDKAIEHVATFESRPPPVTVSGDVARGRILYASCAACHGAKAEGNLALNAPALAARTDWYLVTQLKNYATGLRGTDTRDSLGAQMRAVALSLPDNAAFNDIVAYINTLH